MQIGVNYVIKQSIVKLLIEIDANRVILTYN
jgi:hypothetical protein